LPVFTAGDQATDAVWSGRQDGEMALLGGEDFNQHAIEINAPGYRAFTVMRFKSFDEFYPVNAGDISSSIIRK